jgi:hypothetical protein
MGQKFAAFDEKGTITAFYDSVDSPVPEGQGNVIAITDEQWQSCISGAGFTVVNGALVAPAPPSAAQLLQAAKDRQTAVLSTSCRDAILSGFQSSALGAPHTYPSQMTDQQNLSASVLASLLPGLQAGWTTPFWCADANGNWTYADHTAAQIQQVGQDAKNAIISALRKKAQLAAAVGAAKTVAAVQAITWG